ncbi:MAG: FtsB family cell division protein [Leadbetterella sp.]
MYIVSSPFFRKYGLYILSGIAFFVWVMYFDRSNIMNLAKMYSQVRSLNKQSQHFDKELERIKIEEASVFESKNSIEAYAREKYLMKKPNETVFIMVDENDKLIKESDSVE